MKRTFALSVLLYIMLVVLTLSSCSTTKEQEVILRGRSLETGKIAPLLTTFRYNVYKIGDTVWVDKQSSKIQNVGPISINRCCEQFIIEEDNDSLQSSYLIKPVKQ